MPTHLSILSGKERSVNIVVLGCIVRDGVPSRTLRSRLDVAAALWHEHHSSGELPILSCLGGATRGERPESLVMVDYLLDQGIPASCIIAETASKTTEENLKHIRAILDAPDYPYGWVGGQPTPHPGQLPVSDQRHQIHIVTSTTHAFRTSLLARAHNLDITITTAPEPRRFLPKHVFREIGAFFLWGYRSVRERTH